MNSDRTASVASGAGNTILTARPSRLRRVLVTTAGTGTGQVTFSDNATTNSGTIIGIIPATTTVGTYYIFDLPATFGIVCTNVLNGPVLTVSMD